MKTEIFTLWLITNAFCIYSQTLISPPPFKTLEARVSEEGIELGEWFGEIFIDSTSNIIYTTPYSAQVTEVPIGLDLWQDVLDGEYFQITKIDENVNKINQTGFFGNNEKKPWNVHYIGLINNDLELLIIGENSDFPDEFLFMRAVLDSSLHTMEENWFPIPIEDFYNLIDVIKNQSGNFVMTGLLNSLTPLGEQEKFICEMTPEGDLVRYRAPLGQLNDTWINDGSLQQMPGGQYIVHPYYIMDGDFNDIALYNETALINSASIEPVDSSRFVFGGTGVMLTNNNTQLLNYEALCVGHLDGQVDTIFFNSWPNIFVQTYPGIRSISATDTNHIYFATHRDGFFSHEPTYVSLHSIRLDGTINWSYRFGGDASYTPIDVITMPDGGCLLLVWKLYWQPPIAHTLSDIDYVLFDVYGNVVDVSSPTHEAAPADAQLKVFPNPANEVVFVGGIDLATVLRMDIYSANGATVDIRKVRDGKVDLSDLPVGTYFYSLYDGERAIYSGKLVIER